MPEAKETGTTPKVKSARHVMPPLPGHVDVEAWETWCRHRREIGHPVTPLAAREHWRQLSGLSGPDQKRMVSETINRGWRGLKREWIDRILPRRREEPLLMNLLTGVPG
jgi:hypothetical protein